MDDRRGSGGGSLVVFLLVLLLVAVGGLTFVGFGMLRLRTAAEQARMEAAVAAEQSQVAALRLKEEIDKAKGQAGPADGPKASNNPTDPLGDLNGAFRAAYRAARQEMLERGGPVAFVSGDDLVLVRNGKRTALFAVPALYHDLKSYSHITLAAYLLTRPGPGQTFEDNRRAELTLFLNKLQTVRGFWNTQPLSEEQKKRQQTIVDESIKYITAAESAQTVKPADRSAYAKAMTPLVMANASDAARIQIDGIHKVVTGWRNDLSPEEWKRLTVVVAGTQMPRQGNLAVQYFAWLLGEPGEGKRIIYSEGIFDEAKALGLLGTHRLDGDMAAAFFGDDRRLHRDLLSDAAKDILKDMKP